MLDHDDDADLVGELDDAIELLERLVGRLERLVATCRESAAESADAEPLTIAHDVSTWYNDDEPTWDELVTAVERLAAGGYEAVSARDALDAIYGPGEWTTRQMRAAAATLFQASRSTKTNGPARLRRVTRRDRDQPARYAPFGAQQVA